MGNLLCAKVIYVFFCLTPVRAKRHRCVRQVRNRGNACHQRIGCHLQRLTDPTFVWWGVVPTLLYLRVEMKMGWDGKLCPHSNRKGGGYRAKRGASGCNPARRSPPSLVTCQSLRWGVFCCDNRLLYSTEVEQVDIFSVRHTEASKHHTAVRSSV